MVLLVGDLPIFRLDIDPARSHFNLSTMTKSEGTHWQVWPDMEAQPESANRSHRQWLDEFLRRSKIWYRGVYVTPPYQDPQIALL